MLDEFHVTSESNNRIRRNIIRNDISTLDLFAKKTSSIRIRYLRVAKQREQCFTVHSCQNNRWPLLRMTSLNVSHGHVFPIDILPLSARSDGVREQQLVWHGTAAHESLGSSPPQTASLLDISGA
jgi:hypothetical protein